MTYFNEIRRRMPHFFNGVSVLEYVPYSRCKTVAHLFEDSRYVVVDPSRKDLSDVPSNSFTVAMSIDMFHRTPNYLDMFKELHRVSYKLVMFSCAAAGTVPREAGYWQNLVEADFSTELDLDSMFDTFVFFPDHDHTTLYFWGVKKNEV